MTESNAITSGRRQQDNPAGVSQALYRKVDSTRCRQISVSRHRHARHRGVAFVWVAVFWLLLVFLVGLSLDTAKVRLVAHQLQNAADAAALAGGPLVKTDRYAARMQAIAIGFENFADQERVQLAANEDNIPQGDIVVGWYNRRTQTFTPMVDATEAVNALKVVARRTEPTEYSPGGAGPVPLNFGPIVHVDTSSVARHAIAMSIGGAGAGLIALTDTGTGLYMNGNFTLHVNTIPPAVPGDGEIMVNSGSVNATAIDGKSIQIDASALNVYGDIDESPGYEFTVPYSTGVPPIQDPLGWLPEPTWDPSTDLTPDGNTITISSGEATFGPGYYSGGFDIGGGTVTLTPGIYILGGGNQDKGGLVIGGDANFYADGVMFFITDNGKADMRGSGAIHTSPIDFERFSYPPDVPAHYQGTTVFQSRQNTNEAYIKGTGLLDLEGTLYFPRNHVNIRGEGDGFGNQLIAWSLDIRGSGDIGIDYDGRNRDLPTGSFLVE